MYGHAHLLLAAPCACGKPVTVEEEGVRQCAACALAGLQSS